MPSSNNTLTTVNTTLRLGEPARTSVGDTAKDEKGQAPNGDHPGTYMAMDLVTGSQSPATIHPAPLLTAGRPGLVASASTQTSVSVNGGCVRVPFSDAINFSATPGFRVEAWVHPQCTASEIETRLCALEGALRSQAADPR